MQDAPATSGVKSVQLAFGVLEAVANAPTSIGVSELAAALGTTKGTVFRHLQTLLDLGYVSQDAVSARYSLGVRAHLLSGGAPKIDVLAAAEAEARRLRDEVGETTVVSLVTANALVVGLTVLGRAPIEIGVRPGSELSLHATAQGKVALAFSRYPILDRALRGGLSRHTAATITDPERLREEIRSVRRLGYAAAFEEEARGIGAIAAPVFDSHGDGVATLAIVGLSQAVPSPPDASQLHALAQAAARISARLGFRPDEHPDLPSLESKDAHASLS